MKYFSGRCERCGRTKREADAFNRWQDEQELIEAQERWQHESELRDQQRELRDQQWAALQAYAPLQYLDTFSAEMVQTFQGVASAGGSQEQQLTTAMRHADIAAADPDLKAFKALARKWVPRSTEVLATYVQHRRSDAGPAPDWPGAVRRPARSSVLYVILAASGHAYRWKPRGGSVHEGWIDGPMPFRASPPPTASDQEDWEDREFADVVAPSLIAWHLNRSYDTELIGYLDVDVAGRHLAHVDSAGRDLGQWYDSDCQIPVVRGAFVPLVGVNMSLLTGNDQVSTSHLTAPHEQQDPDTT